MFCLWRYQSALKMCKCSTQHAYIPTNCAGSPVWASLDLPATCVNVCLQAQAKSLIPTEISRMCSMQINGIAVLWQWHRNAWCVPAQAVVASLTAGEVSLFSLQDRKVKSDSSSHPSTSLPCAPLTSEIAFWSLLVLLTVSLSLRQPRSRTSSYTSYILFVAFLNVLDCNAKHSSSTHWILNIAARGAACRH